MYSQSVGHGETLQSHPHVLSTQVPGDEADASVGSCPQARGRKRVTTHTGSCAACRPPCLPWSPRVGPWLCQPVPGGPGVCEYCSGPCDDMTGTDHTKSCPRRRPALVHRLTGRRAAQAFLRCQTSRFRFHRVCVALTGVVKNLTHLLTPTRVQGRLLAGAAQLSGRSPAPGPTLTHGVRSCSPVASGTSRSSDGPCLQMACCDRVQKQMIGAGRQLLSTQRSWQALLSKLQGQGLSVFRKTTENVKLSCEAVSREPLWKRAFSVGSVSDRS